MNNHRPLVRRNIAALTVLSILIGGTAFAAGCTTQTPKSADPPNERAGLPAKYDLRDVDGANYVTPIKIQSGTKPNGQLDLGNTVGACWAFASCASFESSLLKQGIVTDSTSPKADLSEWHMANWNGYNNTVRDFHKTPLPGTDPPEPSSYTIMEPEVMGWGGPSYMAIDYLASGKGAVLEERAQYPTADIQAKRTLTAPPRVLPTTYRLREALIYRASDYETEDAYRSAIKKAVMDNGVVQSIMFFDAGGYYGQKGKSFFDKKTSTYYLNDEKLAGNLNHAVAIVGWDDEHPVKGAPGPGAWLIKNSAGKTFGDDGYLWISYADATFLKGEDFAVSFIADKPDGYSAPSSYQTHDGAGTNLPSNVAAAADYLSTGSSAVGRDSWGAARFTARADEQLKAVGIMTLDPGEELEIVVYRRWDEDTGRPTDEIYREKRTIAVPGYHALDLKRPVALGKNDDFVVAVGFGFDVGHARGPLAYAVGEPDAPSPARTYLACAKGGKAPVNWQPFGKSMKGRVLYLQAIMGARK